MKINSPATAAMNAITAKVIDVRNVNTPTSLVEGYPLNSHAKAHIVGGLSRFRSRHSCGYVQQLFRDDVFHGCWPFRLHVLDVRQLPCLFEERLLWPVSSPACALSATQCRELPGVGYAISAFTKANER